MKIRVVNFKLKYILIIDLLIILIIELRSFNY